MESSGGDVTALDKMQLLIGRQMRVLITDGRLIQGEFQCIDSDMNIILNDATEFHGVEDGEFGRILSNELGGECNNLTALKRQ